MAKVALTTSQELPALAAENERLRAAAVNAGIRVFASALFLALAFGVWRSAGLEGWRDQIPVLAGYLVVALAVFALRRNRAVDQLGWILSLCDLGIAYVVLRGVIAADLSIGPAIAGMGLGVFVLLVTLNGLALRNRFLWLVTLTAMIAQCLLLDQAGLSVWPMVACACVLLLASAIGIAVSGRTASLAREIAEAELTQRLLAETRAQYQKLENLQRDKDSLVQLIVHDLRSPVSATIMSLEFLAGELKHLPASPAMLEAIDDGLVSSNSVSDMIAQILDTAKLEEGRITLHLTRVSARELLEAAQQQAMARARQRHVDIAVEVSPADLGLVTDPRLFPRLLENLVSNALRHTPADGRILLLAARAGGEIVLSVHNSGDVIAAADRERIFDKFQQGEGEARRMSGWGLGLYFCRLVAEAHCGRIAVEDVEGWPTSFVIRLPGQAPLME